MKVGYFPCTQDPPRGENIARIMSEVIVEAQIAEKVGFDSCLFSEHHQQADAYIPNPLLAAGLEEALPRLLRQGAADVPPGGVTPAGPSAS